jgi:hypothetical protein
MTTMHLYDLAGYGKAQAGASFSSRARIVDLLELLENLS